MTGADLDAQGITDQIIFNDRNNKSWTKGFSADEWNKMLTDYSITDEEYEDGKRTYLNTKPYMASPYKIQSAASKNPDTWSTFDQSDFQKAVPEGERLDPRSEEYWNKYINITFI